MHWTVQVTVVLLSTVWIIFFLKTDPLSVFVQRRSSDEEVQSGTSSSAAEECRIPADIAFLLDGSGSVLPYDFKRMKTFVKHVIRTFKGNNTKFAIVQFSTYSTIHYYFDTFDANTGQIEIDGINQLSGGTNTASALQRVVQEVFTPTRGSRSNVKVLIVITDGLSQDSDQLPAAAKLAEKQNIVRFVIEVGSIFYKPGAKQELDTIASSPSEDHVFQADNFEALENIRQNLEAKTKVICQETPRSTQDKCRNPADIAFLLDGSGTVSPDDFQRMKKFVKDVISSFQGNHTKFAIVQFSTDSTVHYYFDTFDANIRQTEIDGINQLHGLTFTATALQRVVQDVFTPTRGSRSDVKVLIVITDGLSQERNKLPAAANLAEQKNIVRFVIGVGDAFYNPGAKQELDTIASSPPEDHVFQAHNFETLENIRQNLEDKTKATCQETPKSTQDKCRNPADIAFLLDGSATVSSDDFQRMKKFVKDVISSFQGNHTKFAIVQFSTDSTIHYYFDTFDANIRQTEIDGINQLNGMTNTATALQRVVQDVFTPTRGSRSDVKVLIVITDGLSQEQNKLPAAANLAEQKKIVRFVIGVGDAFSNPLAKQELNTIASSPPEDHVFQAHNFETLENIRQNLEDKTKATCQETPKSTQDKCRNPADIAFLLDGSATVSSDDFQRMKKFVKDVISSFQGNHTKFAIVQFSTDSTIHYYFDTFDANIRQTEIDGINQLNGMTNTATALQRVVQEVFTPTRGSRSDVKVLIVITDGLSQEQNKLPAAANLAEQKNIVRFVIGVGDAFSNPLAKQELDTIASSPPGDHVFQAHSFETLENIRQNLEDKTKATCQETPKSTQDKCGTKADIAFLLDGSSSVSSPDFQRMKKFVKHVISSFQGKNTKFAIVQFSSTSTIHYYFDTFDANVGQTQIDEICQLGGQTFTASAIRTVVQDVFTPTRGSRSNVKVLMVITDGESSDRHDLVNAVNLVEYNNIVRFVIGVGDAFYKYEAKQELNTIASSPPEGHVFQADNFEALENIRQNLEDKTKEICRETPRSTQDKCKIPADIAFLLDGSESVVLSDFQRMKKFVKHVISSFQGKNTKFAIVQFSSNSTIHYYFDTFDANIGQTQIDGICQVGGQTFTASAIRTVVQEVFTPTRGSRSNVKVVIVITDGESTDQHDLLNAVNLAEYNKIVRFVIGVGDAFFKPGAKQELNTIASSPPEDHVFRVENFEALENIRQNLEDKTKEICQETQKSTQDNGGMKASSASG